MSTGVCFIFWFLLCENPCSARSALEDPVCYMNWPMCCSQEGLSDPNCTAFFPLKAFRFSCSNFAISCGENNGLFTNALHPAARVENSVGKKRHSLIYSWTLWGGVWQALARTQFWAGFPGSLWWSCLKGDFNVPSWASWVVTKWPFKFVFLCWTCRGEWRCGS